MTNQFWNIFQTSEICCCWPRSRIWPICGICRFWVNFGYLSPVICSVIDLFRAEFCSATRGKCFRDHFLTFRRNKLNFLSSIFLKMTNQFWNIFQTSEICCWPRIWPICGICRFWVNFGYLSPVVCSAIDFFGLDFARRRAESVLEIISKLLEGKN